MSDADYERGYAAAVSKIKSLANSYAVAMYGAEGAQISMLILMLVEEALNVDEVDASIDGN